MVFLALAALVAAPLSASSQGQQDQRGRTMDQGMIMGRPTMGMPMMSGDCPVMDMPGQRMATGPDMMPASQWVEGRIAFLRVELGIRPEQEEAFSRLADALRKSAKIMNELRRSMPAMIRATTVERYDARVRRLEARLDGMKAVKDALPGLYAVLTEEQKQSADQFLGMGLM